MERVWKRIGLAHTQNEAMLIDLLGMFYPILVLFHLACGDSGMEIYPTMINLEHIGCFQR